MSGRAWVIVLAAVGYGLWARQCGVTNAARAQYDAFRDSAAAVETRLSDSLEVARERSAAAEAALGELVSANDGLRRQNARLRQDALEREAEAVSNLDLSQADVDDLVAAIPMPEIREPLRRAINLERADWRMRVVAVEDRALAWERDAGLWKAERDSAINVVIPSLRDEVGRWEQLAEQRLARALRAEDEVDKERDRGLFDIGIPDWAGAVGGFVLGVGTGFVIEKLTGGSE